MAGQRESAMLATMARMQDAHNTQVHPEWRTQGYAYYRAIWVECAEMLDHYGWKWWKHQEADLDQVKLELVDIWHFGLSELLRSNTLGDEVVDVLRRESAAEPSAEALRLAIEALAASSLESRSFSAEAFGAAMGALPMDFDELYRLYVGKNVLNHFRQDHGYKTGSYIKVWHGREDNEHLVELLTGIDLGAADAPEQVYEGLAARYPAG